MKIDGILNVNKPEGRTSFSIIAWLRKLIGEKHIGHTGTLDPMATGVLPVCLGQATKITRFLIETDKSYTAQIELGITTDTFDGDGKIVKCSDVGKITNDNLSNALSSFVGTISQVPPIYSAIKYHGKPYYYFARSGEAIKPVARTVKIHNLEIIECNLPVVTIKLECGKGTYVRSLANDLGEILGCGAYLKKLIRTKSGIFTIEDSYSLSKVEEAFARGDLEKLIYPVDYPLNGYKKVVLSQEEERIVTNGGHIMGSAAMEQSDELWLAYNNDNKLAAILDFNLRNGQWHPLIVFRK
jgi:tRNA pseudouridine55 synthase